MKKTEKKKPVSTIPEGVWEASRLTSDKRDKNNKLSTSADLQGNGYPARDKVNPESE